MAMTNLRQAARPANLAEAIQQFSIHGPATPFYDFGTSDFTDQRLCEASAICHIFETGMSDGEPGDNSEVECLIPDIKAGAIRAVSTLIELALLSHRWSELASEAGQ